MALLHIVAGWARRAGRRPLAVTIDHGLNPDSSAWSRRCEAAARAVGADWIGRCWEGEKPTAGVSAAARRARHSLIAETARQAGAKVILLAHTADDIAEADWMRARPVAEGGSTLGGLREWSPSPAWPQGRGLMLLRPLLGERRATLRHWLSEQGAAWIEDPANTDDRYARSRARKALATTRAAPGFAGAHSAPTPSSRPPRALDLGEGFADVADLGPAILCAAGHDRLPRADRLATLSRRLWSGEAFTTTLAGARVVAHEGRAVVIREHGELRRRAPPDLLLRPGEPAVWDGRYEITVSEPGWTVTAALGRLARLSRPDRAIVNAVAAPARGALPVLIRDDGPAPILAWRAAEVRSLAPRRLALASGEMTREADLHRPVSGETPPPDLFSSQDHTMDATVIASADENPQ